MFETLATLVLLLVALFVLIPYLRSGTPYGAPFVPMDRQVVERVMDLADVRTGKVFCDLGSGDGRLVIAAALRGAKARGVEIDRTRVLYSRFWIWLLRIKNAEVIEGNLFDQDLRDVDVLNLYLLPQTNEKLIPKLEQELKKGTLVVATGFKVGDWKPVKIDPNGVRYGPIYVYKKP